MPIPADRLLPRRSFLGLAAAGVLSLTVAGCGGDDDGDAASAPETSAADEPGTTTQETITAEAGTAADEDAVQVSMKDIQFVPKVVTAKVGQTIVWTNDESVQHDVRALEGAKFQSELFGKGGTYEYTAKKVGTIEYDCSVHPGMVGTLKVVA